MRTFPIPSFRTHSNFLRVPPRLLRPFCKCNPTLQPGTYKHFVILKKMLYLIGLGLGDATDITLKGLRIIRKCERVYLETYTSILSVSLEDLAQFYGCSIREADRELVESRTDEILPKDENENVALLVAGDPFGATTHTDLLLRAREKGVGVKVIHNSSILTAIGCCGLQLYRFGETVSIPYWNKDWRPNSFYDKIISNRQRDLHTLCLLDIKVKEPTIDSITKKKKEYMPPRFMSVSEAAQQLVQIIEERIETSKNRTALSKSSTVVGLARIGWDNQDIIVCCLEKLMSVDLGPPLHCLVVPAVELHPLELECMLTHMRDDRAHQP